MSDFESKNYYRADAFTPYQALLKVIPNLWDLLAEDGMTSVWSSPQEVENEDITGLAYDLVKHMVKDYPQNIGPILSVLNEFEFSEENWPFFDEFFETIDKKVKDRVFYMEIISLISTFDNLNLYLKPWLELQ